MPLAVVEVTAVTVGAVVSMTIDLVPAIEPAEPGVGSVRSAALGLVRVEDGAAVERQRRRCWCSRASGYSGRRRRCR